MYDPSIGHFKSPQMWDLLISDIICGLFETQIQFGG